MKSFVLLVFVSFFHAQIFSQESVELASVNADAIVDMRTKEGMGLLKAIWRYSPAKFVDTNFNAPGPSNKDPLLLYPTGKKITTQSLDVQAKDVDYNDTSWPEINPETMEERRGTGLGSFAWYRTKVTVPEKFGKVSARGTTLIFEIVVDDYAEVWVDGKLKKTFGQSGGQVIKGFNARNRVFLTKNATPGQQISIAVLGINGPLSDLPDNYIWLRSCTLDVHSNYTEQKSNEKLGRIVQYHPDLTDIVSKDQHVELLAKGFQFIEGPVWHPSGFLLFSDPNANVIYKYEPYTDNVSIYITKSGYNGIDIGDYHQPGSNGLAIDSKGRLIVCQHGNRRIVRHERKGPVSILSDNYQEKRLNSPNDLAIKSDGTIYFTDPPYGLPNAYNDKHKELPFQGIYRIADGKTHLLSKEIGGPNGIAFSPNEDYLYVGNWDIRDIYNSKTVWRYPVMPNGNLGKGTVFYNFDQTEEAEAIDGIKVDSKGNLFVSAPGGVWILNNNGKLLGKIITPERPANMTWGDDGKSLYMTAHGSLYKLIVKTGKNNINSQ
ncbi:MAG: SMP-30/gluconolactonase/LRE family protein [Cyanobacteria bacterium P01_A01_bin.84]